MFSVVIFADSSKYDICLHENNEKKKEFDVCLSYLFLMPSLDIMFICLHIKFFKS